MPNNISKTTDSAEVTKAVVDDLDRVLNHLKTIEQSMQHLLSSYANNEATTSMQIESTHSAFEQVIQLVINQRKTQRHETET